MKCVLCKNGETIKGFATVTLQKENTTVVFKKVPADICENCGEYYLDENITENLLTRANKSAKNKKEIEVLQFAA
jgi:YgiT-type zinc finger domain-containing protein